ncbi:MAG: 50S ribosomal protein L11 methyltransferase [Deltaproteobacteria bacterium]|nr:50S ribosomal protein L11 methyltransferase [Deltaproteobacteria bacterium]
MAEPGTPKAPRPGLAVIVPPDMAEEAGCLLIELGACAVEQRDESTLSPAGSDLAQLFAGFDERDARDLALKALAPSSVRGLEAVAIEVEDDGWNAGWRRFFEPVVLSRVQVITTWMSPPRNDRITITIDPGLAFGTGGHASTRLLLGLLEERTAARGLAERVLDVGSGSGILAIAAALLGAREVLAVDVDPESVAATLENSLRNGVESAIRAELGTAGSIAGEWPLVLANLQLAIFETDAPAVAARVAARGEVLVSGILAEEVEACVALFPGLRIAGRIEADGWAALALVQP